MSKHGGLNEILTSGRAPGIVRPSGVKNRPRLVERLVPPELQGAARDRAVGDAHHAVDRLDRGYRSGEIDRPKTQLE